MKKINKLRSISLTILSILLFSYFGALAPDPDIIEIVDVNIDNETFKVDPSQMQSFINEMFTYHIRGIASNKGIKFLEKHIEDINQKNHE